MEQIFDLVASEMGKERSKFDVTMEKFVEMGATDQSKFDDALFQRIVKPEAGIPAGITATLVKVIKSLNAKVTDFKLKQALIIHEKDYSTLRQIAGCEGVGDIDQEANEIEKATGVAKGLGIEEADITVLTGVKTTDIESTLTSILNRINKNEESLLFVYCSGHGIGDGERYLMMNDADIHLYPIENRLRAVTAKSATRVIAVYDLDRLEKKNYEQLKTSDASGPFVDVTDATKKQSYLHIGTQPNNIVHNHSLLCDLVTTKLNNAANKQTGIVEIPSALSDLQGVELKVSSEDYSIKWARV